MKQGDVLLVSPKKLLIRGSRGSEKNVPYFNAGREDFGYESHRGVFRKEGMDRAANLVAACIYVCSDDYRKCAAPNKCALAIRLTLLCPILIIAFLS